MFIAFVMFIAFSTFIARRRGHGMLNSLLSSRFPLLVLLVSVAFGLPGWQLPAGAESTRTMTGVVSKELVKATPEEVFRAIRTYRRSDAAKRSVVEEKTGEATIHEMFSDVPILGQVECTYVEKEVPYSRIDYKMINSQKLKVFEGCWQLTPMEDGKETLVRLMSYLNTDLNVPMKEFLQHLSMHNDIHKRLSFVKEQAEKYSKEDQAKASKDDPDPSARSSLK